MSTATLPGRAGPAALVVGQTRYSLTELWRARVVLIFSLLIPLVWLGMVGAQAGNAVLDEVTGIRVMQFATPLALTMGTLYATLPTVAITMTQARETGVLKRLRGTPLPTWAYLAGRSVAAFAFAALSVAAASAVAVIAFDVQVVRRTLLATTVTLLVAVVCFIAIGLGVAALCRTTSVAQAASIGGVVVLSFISGLFTIGAPLPSAVTAVADALPVKPLAETLQDQLNPYVAGSGWDVGTLLVLLAWGAAGAAVAGRRMRESAGPTRRGRGPQAERGDRAEVSTRGAAPLVHAAPAGERGVVASVPPVLSVPSGTLHGRPSAPALVLGQAGAAARSARRDPGGIFFAVIVPVGLYALIATAAADAPPVRGAPFTVHLAAGMVTWGVAVTAFMNAPEAVVRARDRGVLKRLHGTPLMPGHYVAGRLAAALVVAVLIGALVLGLGVAAYDVEPTVSGVLLGTGLLVLGTLTLAACGFLLATVVRDARTFGAVALVVLLPVAFTSDVFTTGGPDWLGTVGAVFPLKHLQNALTDVLAGGATSGTWWHVAALTGWAVVAGVLALRYFRWDEVSR